MSNAAPDQFPTMVIPRGTEIRINDHGQLSIRTPGNLVIQNSGTYAEIESTNGSIRIEDNVSVEAVSIRAAESCFIQGTLTAWRVVAKRIALEDSAKAHIMLRESDEIELSRNSRLVGNFTSEKELYLLLGKFSRQLKELPAAVEIGDELGKVSFVTREQRKLNGDDTNPRPDLGLPEPLAKAAALMDRELQRKDIDPAQLSAIREVSFALQDRDLPRARMIYKAAFSELSFPSERLQQAFELIDTYFNPS
jgi:hypothetical protein